MGESTTFSCDACGYQSAQIRWGVSMLDPRCRFMPAHCMRCRSYVEVDLTGADLLVDQFHCDSCGSELFFVERAESYPCPRCGWHKVRLQQGPEYW